MHLLSLPPLPFILSREDIFLKLLNNFECGELLLYVTFILLSIILYIIVGKINSQVIALFAAVSKL